LREASPKKIESILRVSPLKESTAIFRESSPFKRQAPLRLEDEDELVRALRE